MAATHEFTTIRTADILDNLVAAVDAIRASTAVYNKPWMNALDKAWGYILEQDAISYDLSAYAIRVESATEAGRFYEANGDCQCEAFTKGNGICWHRAAARLVRRALELREEAEVSALAGELYDEAREAGCTWYDAEVAAEGARARMPELLDFAAAWDATAARIGRAQAAAMARAA